MLWGRNWIQLNEKKSLESQTRLMSCYRKRKPTWSKDLITYDCNSRIMFPFNWLVIIWRGVVWNWTSKFWTKLDKGVGVLKFSCTSYVYRPLISQFWIIEISLRNKSVLLCTEKHVRIVSWDEKPSLGNSLKTVGPSEAHLEKKWCIICW